MGAAAEEVDGGGTGPGTPSGPPAGVLRRSKITLVDAAVILAAAVAIFFSSLGAVDAAGALRAVITDAQGAEWIYPMEGDREIEVEGPLGVTIVHIHEGGVSIESSPCPNQTCVAAGSVDRSGQWIACLPNQVFVRVEGGSDEPEGVDTGTW